MTTLNLSPKNPLVIVGLAAGAIWLMSRRTAAAAHAVQPVGPAQSNAGVVSQALGAITSLFNSVAYGGTPVNAADAIRQDQARAAVRAGDPYYGGTGYDAAIAGTAPDNWNQDAANAAQDAARAAVRFGDTYYGL